MVFYRDDLRLVELRDVPTKKGDTMKVAKLADRESYDSVELILARNHSMKGIVAGNDYNVELKVDGKWMSATLTTEQ